MSGSTTSSPFGARAQGGDGRGPIEKARQLLEQLRDPEQAQVRAGTRSNRADVRAVVLTLLLDHPMNGYEIVRALAASGDGSPTPGAGAVYPVLQLIADEGLADASDTDGRKVYSLTAAGRVAAEAARDRGAAEEAPTAAVPRGPVRRGALSRSAAQLVQTAVLVSRTGAPQQVAEAVDVLDDARRTLVSILARN